MLRRGLPNRWFRGYYRWPRSPPLAANWGGSSLPHLVLTHLWSTRLQFFGTDADAQEILQEVFLSLYEDLDQFQGRAALATFLYRMTTNACLSRLRSESNRDRLRRENLMTTSEATADSALSPEELLLLQNTIKTMPNELAHAAVLYIVDGLTHREIARILGCFHSHVGHLLQRLESWSSEREAAL